MKRFLVLSFTTLLLASSSSNLYAQDDDSLYAPSIESFSHYPNPGTLDVIGLIFFVPDSAVLETYWPDGSVTEATVQYGFGQYEEVWGVELKTLSGNPVPAGEYLCVLRSADWSVIYDIDSFGVPGGGGGDPSGGIE